MSESRPQPKERRHKHPQSPKPPTKRGCCYSSCCCGCCCSRCCRSGSRESNLDRPEGPDDEAYITAINSRQTESDPINRKRKKDHWEGETEGQKHSRRCKKCCKSVTAFIFSHVGLCCLVVAYSIMGGFLFQWLESESEVTERSNVKKSRTSHLQRLWNMTNFLNVLHEENWTRQADDILQSFQDAIFTAVKEKGWDGRDEDTLEMQWSFAGSLLYSITVITTIGYGHIAPKTEMGRLATMFYAMVGIPLTLLCLANIGSFFGNCFRFLYKHVCGGLVWLCCPSHYSVQKPHPYLEKNAEDAIAAMGDSAIESQPKGKNGKKNNLHNGSKGNQFKGQRFTTNSTPLDEPDSLEALRQKGSPGDAEKGFYACTDVRADVKLMPSVAVKTTKRKKTLKEEVRVPMLVSLMIIALYIFGGAVLFSVWEPDWDYLIGSYFCFITLSTIGFGDYVFGTGLEWNNSEKLIICTLYLAFGLSIIAMGFDLMQEEVRAKFSWLGAKLGIIDDEDDDECED